MTRGPQQARRVSLSNETTRNYEVCEEAIDGNRQTCGVNRVRAAKSVETLLGANCELDVFSQSNLQDSPATRARLWLL